MTYRFALHFYRVCIIEDDGLEITLHTYIHNKSYSAQSYIKTQRLCITKVHTYTARHRASTSMYSLTFCVRVMSPERHHWKPAVQAAAVMLRTPPRRQPVTGQPATPTSHIRCAILRTPHVTRRSPASSAHTPPSVRTMSSYRGMDASL